MIRGGTLSTIAIPELDLRPNVAGFDSIRGAKVSNLRRKNVS